MDSFLQPYPIEFLAELELSMGKNMRTIVLYIGMLSLLCELLALVMWTMYMVDTCVPFALGIIALIVATILWFIIRRHDEAYDKEYGQN